MTRAMAKDDTNIYNDIIRVYEMLIRSNRRDEDCKIAKDIVAKHPLYCVAGQLLFSDNYHSQLSAVNIERGERLYARCFKGTTSYACTGVPIEPIKFVLVDYEEEEEIKRNLDLQIKILNDINGQGERERWEAQSISMKSEL